MSRKINNQNYMNNKIILILIFFFSISYSFSQTMDDFFKYKGVKVLASLAHPTNTFKSGSYEIYSSAVYVNIYYESYTTKLKITRDGNFFTKTDVIEDNDFVAPFAMVELIKDLALELIVNSEDQQNKSTFEKKINKTISNMNGKDLACLVLTLNWFDYQPNSSSSSNSNYNQNTSSFKDSRDGKTYKTAKIGSQTWMVENLSYKPAGGGYWPPNGNNSNIYNYGYLYNYETAIKVCPLGWHLPNNEEWNILEKQIDRKRDNIFNLQPAGNRRGDYIGNYKHLNGTYEKFNEEAFFWAIDKPYGDMTSYHSGGYYEGLWYFGGYGNRGLNDKESAFSVRCVKD